MVDAKSPVHGSSGGRGGWKRVAWRALLLFLVFSLVLPFFTVVVLQDRYQLPSGTGLVLAGLAVAVAMIWTSEGDRDVQNGAEKFEDWESPAPERSTLVAGPDPAKLVCSICGGEFVRSMTKCPDCQPGPPLH